MNNVLLDAVIETGLLETAEPTASATSAVNGAAESGSFPTLLVVGIAVLVVGAVYLIFKARKR